ncbi:hypothetical protein GpartN1_g4042.t1 [Galdieria partita]|uniref:Uncharacterized protein n=1 Tax=Galdieria partita TaxID=83374 RepID=A0A9C7UQZ1_9RHOD|nr:hypothetical protein GpartN1_g4042.t1 [Galdieria partita]
MVINSRLGIPLWLCWIFFLVSVILEGAGTTCMKASQSFQKRLPAAGAFICYNLCVLTMVFAYTRIEMTIGYAVWCGLGIILTSLVGIFFFREKLSFAKVVGMIVTLVGILILVWFQDSIPEENESAVRFSEEPLVEKA